MPGRASPAIASAEPWGGLRITGRVPMTQPAAPRTQRCDGAGMGQVALVLLCRENERSWRRRAADALDDCYGSHGVADQRSRRDIRGQQHRGWLDAAPGDGVCAMADGACSLRAALQEANVLTGSHVITLPAGVYTLTIRIRLVHLEIVSGPITINGAGAATTIIEANQIDHIIDHIFNIAFGALTLNDVTAQNSFDSCSVQPTTLGSRSTALWSRVWGKCNQCLPFTLLGELGRHGLDDHAKRRGPAAWCWDQRDDHGLDHFGQPRWRDPCRE